jgi:hypothetical protein
MSGSVMTSRSECAKARAAARGSQQSLTRVQPDARAARQSRSSRHARARWITLAKMGKGKAMVCQCTEETVDLCPR